MRKIGGQFVATLALLLALVPFASAQKPQSSPSLFIPGLTPPVPANWTTFGANCTSSTTSTIGSATALLVTGQTGTTNTCGIKVAASGNFSHVLVIAAVPNLVNFSGILVGFTDGTKYETCGVAYNGSFQTTAISSATLTGTVAAANGTVTNGYGVLSSPQYFRLTSSGTTLSCDYSPDQGNNWFNVFTDTTPFLTVSNVFFGTNQRGGTGVPSGLLLSYK